LTRTEDAWFFLSRVSFHASTVWDKILSLVWVRLGSVVTKSMYIASITPNYIRRHKHIDYRRDDDSRFPESASWVTIFKPRFAFQQLNSCYSWNKKMKKHLFEWARCQKTFGGILFHKEVKSSDSTTWFKSLTVSNPTLKMVYAIASSCWTGFHDHCFWEMEARLIKWYHCLLFKRQLFFWLHTYSLWLRYYIYVKSQAFFPIPSLLYSHNISICRKWW
jgi:hypothetical protein